MAAYRDQWTQARKFEDLNPGDLIQFSYWGLPHEAIVTDVDRAQSRLSIVHYPTPETFFSRRRLTEEMREVHPESARIWVLDCPIEYSYPADEVIRRARARVGETRFNMFTRRSSHVARECKIRQHPLMGQDCPRCGARDADN